MMAVTPEVRMLARNVKIVLRSELSIRRLAWTRRTVWFIKVSCFIFSTGDVWGESSCRESMFFFSNSSALVMSVLLAFFRKFMD